MGNPFPGMNPYLEQSEFWHQVHNRLIVAIAEGRTAAILSSVDGSGKATYTLTIKTEYV